ncbi:MAG: hypothetical protein AAGI54_01985 [Planctomycetota bacterium]
MELLVSVLCTSAASAAIGHYVKKSLEKIDLGLGDLFRGNPKPQEVQDYLDTHPEIHNRVTNYAAGLIEQSIVIPPLQLTDSPTLSDKVDLFERIINFGFSVAHAARCDLMLEGSLLGPEKCTLFGTGSTQTTVTRRGMKIDVWQSAFCNLYITPNEIKGINPYTSYLSQLRKHCGRSEARFRFPQSDAFRLHSINAVECKFMALKNMPQKYARSLSIGENQIAPIGVDYADGVAKMLASVEAPLSQRYIERDEAQRMQLLLADLNETASKIAAI